MKARLFGALLMVVLLGCFSSVALASQTNVIASSVAVITAPEASESRLLMKFDLPELPEEHEIYYADITFHVQGLHALQEMELFEVGSDWSAGAVTWENHWNTPGGDIRGERKGCWITDDRTGDLVKFVVTESLSRFLSGSDPDYGFLILCAGENSQLLTLPAEAPVLTVYSGPKREREPRK